MNKHMLTDEGGKYPPKSEAAAPTISCSRGVGGLQGYLAHNKQPPPNDHHMTLDIVLM